MSVLVDLTNVPHEKLMLYTYHVSDWMWRIPNLPITEPQDLGHVKTLYLDHMYLSQGKRWCACGREALFLGDVEFVLSGFQVRFECPKCARMYLPKHLQNVAEYSMPKEQYIVDELVQLGGQIVNFT